jgi:DNA transformation protein and related proteins
MAVSPGYKEYILDLLAGVDGVFARAMFGGVGLYVDDTMFGLITSTDRFYFRVDEINQPDFEAADSEQFIPFEDDPKKNQMRMPYFEVPVDILEDEEELTRWSKNAWEAARRNKKPKKQKKKKA